MELQDVRRTVFRAIDELNEQRPPAERIAPADDVRLVGFDGGLDSLGIVNLVAILEQRIEGDLHQSVSLIDDDVLADASRHFRTVGTTVSYLASRLGVRVDA